MIIISSLKHNSFQNVNIPSGANLFARVGPHNADAKDYSGEEFIDPSLGKLEAAKQVLDEIQQEPTE